MSTIQNFKDVVDWGLCIGCGICLCAEKEFAPIRMEESEGGIRPVFQSPDNRRAPDIEMCPGFSVNSLILNDPKITDERRKESLLVGPYYGIYCGHAMDEKTRIKGSSGGMITALAAFCLETGKADYVVHTGMDEIKPWGNRTVISRNRKELLQYSGSRYISSSPCDSIRIIEQSTEKCLFVGRPCDVAAMRQAMEYKPILKKRITILLTFFCAGTPSSRGAKDLIASLGLKVEETVSLKYRGDGWPGLFEVEDKYGKKGSLTYDESWGYLQKYRPIRCYLCPDGLGQLADISLGDAWNRFEANDPGKSYVVTRSDLGQKYIKEAAASGYVVLEDSRVEDVIGAQDLVKRRKTIHGRLIARRIFHLPVPRFPGFELGRSWGINPFLEKCRIVFGTMRRILIRGYWRKNRLSGK